MRQRPHLVAGQDAGDVQPDLAGGVTGDELVVAGDNLERDALPCEVGDRGRDAGLGGIAEQDHALEDEVPLQRVGGRQPHRASRRRERRDLVRREGPRRHRDEAEAVGGGPVDEGREPGMLRGVDRSRGVVLANASRARHDRLRRALRHDERRIVPPLDDHAEETAVEVVGELGELPVAREIDRRRRLGEDRGVEGIDESGLEVAVEVGERERRGGLHRVVTIDPGRPHQAQLALGQRAGLVRAQDGDAAKVLDRRQALDQHAVPGERPRPPGEVQRDDGRQELGREPDRERNREEERVEKRALQRDVDREDADHEQERHSRNQETERADAELEVGLRRALRQPPRDGPVAGPRPGGRDQRAAGAADDAGPEEDESVALAVAGLGGCVARGAAWPGRRDPRSAAIPRARLARRSGPGGSLEGGRRLTGQRRLVDVEMVRGEEPAVGRDDVAGRKLDDVAPDHVVDGQLLGSPAADHRGAQREACLEGGHGRLRARLLDEPEAGAHRDDRKDDPGLDRVADRDADAARCHEDEDERARELAGQDSRPGAPPLAAKRVRAVGPETLRRLRRAQTGRRVALRGGRVARRGQRGGDGAGRFHGDLSRGRGAARPGTGGARRGRTRSRSRGPRRGFGARQPRRVLRRS